MQKKLQVFISSTYTDLQEERQAAVQAVLSAKHIPAGMELFTAGDQSQLETIKHWIDESDIYCLILGGRYGSIEPESEKSYTHLEYEYALETGKPVFAIVIGEDAIAEKIQRIGIRNADEREYPEKYRQFKALVLSKMCRIVNSTVEIKLAVLEKLIELQGREDLTGWVSGVELPDVKGLTDRILALTEQNEELRKQIKELEVVKSSTNGKVTLSNGLSYETVKKALETNTITIPANISKSSQDRKVSLLEAFESYSDHFATGLLNQAGMTPAYKFVYFSVAPQLMRYGLIEAVKEPRGFQRLRTSKDGHKFLSLYSLEKS